VKVHGTVVKAAELKWRLERMGMKVVIATERSERVVWVDLWDEKDAKRALDSVLEWAGWGSRALWWLPPNEWWGGKAGRGFVEGRGGARNN
jgi:hypothetical protein